MVSPGCVMRFVKYAFTAGEAAMACGIPSTRRCGITLVYSDPGPSVIRSAWAIASSVSFSGRARRGRSSTRSIGRVLRLMRVSPLTFRPPASVASSVTFAAVEG